MTEAATNVPVTEGTNVPVTEETAIAPNPAEGTMAPEEAKAAEEAKATEETAAPEAEKEAEPQMAHRDWWPFESLRREVERVFDDYYRGPWRLPFTRTAFDVAPVWPGEFIFGTTPAVDIVEKDAEYVITAEMPGVAASDVEVGLADGRLTIKGEKKDEKEEDRKGVHVSERRYGAVQRTFRIPPGVDAEKISASFKDGILTVTLPKVAAAQPSERKIDVAAA